MTHRRTLTPAGFVEHGPLCRPDLGLDDTAYDNYWSASATHDSVSIPLALPQGRGVSALGPRRAGRHRLSHHGPRAGRFYCRRRA